MNAFQLSIAGLSIDRAIVESLGWTLLHFIWQGAIVAALLAALDALLSRSRPQLRYLAGCGALLVMLALPVATFVVSESATRGPGASATASIAGNETHRARRIANGPPPIARMVASSVRATRRPELAISSRRSLPALRDLTARLDASRLMPWFVAMWALGVSLLSLRLLGGWWLVRRLERSSRHLAIEAWQGTMTRLAREMGVTRRVRLLRSTLVTVPTAFGWLRPVILLPASTLIGLSPAQIEAILAHELAHIRRHDYVVNLLQSVIETLLFYHPAVWWVSRRIREERELCCDDLAVRASGDPITYARALCELERLRGVETGLALAATGGSLMTRIARLVGASERPRLAASRGFVWLLTASIALIGGAAGGAVRADHGARACAARARDLASAIAPLAGEAHTCAQAARACAAKACSVAEDAREAAAVARPCAEEALAIAPEAACDTHDENDATDAGDVDDAPDVETPETPPTPEAATPSRFSEQDWERLDEAGVSRRYVSEIVKGGYPDISTDQLIELARHGVSASYVNRIRRVLSDPGIDDLIELANHGVSSRYVESMRKLMGDLSVRDLVDLANHGVSSRHADAMKRGLGSPSVQDLIRLANSGVSSEYVSRLQELGLEDLKIDDLIRLANSGVTLDWIYALRWMGYTDITVDRAIELRNSGVTADYAASLRILDRHRFSLDEVRQLRNQGVEVEYAAAMLGMVRKDLTVDQLIRIRQQGVTVEYVASLKALGYSQITPEELIQLRQQGVDLDFIAALAAAGYPGLAVGDLVRLRQNGVDASFVAEVRDAGYGKVDVTELIRLRQRGLARKNLP
jgi:beta-lactamase regulating signal transducer with metallopeptidase domain